MGNPTDLASGVSLVDVVRDLSDPAVWHDPYPYYRRLRERQPVLRTSDGWWLLSRHRDCEQILRDRRAGRPPGYACLSSADVSGGGEADPPAGPVASSPSTNLFDLLPSRQELRDRFAREVAPAVVRPSEPRLRELATGLLATAVEAGEVDLVQAFSRPFPTLVMAELMGVPDIDRRPFGEHAHLIMREFDATYTFATPAEQAQTELANREIGAYVGDLVAARQRDRGDDLLSRIIGSVEADQEPWPQERIVSLAVGFLTLAAHTTSSLIGNGALALARHPGALAQLRATPKIVGTAVEEFLRYDSPAQVVSRVVHQDLALDGHPIRAGEMVMPLVGAAGHDPAAFTDPHLLDLTRQPNPHLAFGHGEAYCFGAPLARIEGRIAFTTLVELAPALALAGEPVFAPTLMNRSVSTLPVRLR